MNFRKRILIERLEEILGLFRVLVSYDMDFESARISAHLPVLLSNHFSSDDTNMAFGKMWPQLNLDFVSKFKEHVVSFQYICSLI